MIIRSTPVWTHERMTAEIARFHTLAPRAKYYAIDTIFDAMVDPDPAIRANIRNWAETQVRSLRERRLRIHMVQAAQRVLMPDPAALDDSTFARQFAFATTLYEKIEPSVHEDFVRTHRQQLGEPAWRLYLYLYLYGPEDRETYCDFVQSPDPFAWYAQVREKGDAYRYGHPGPRRNADKASTLAAWFALDRPRRDQYHFPHNYENEAAPRAEKLTWPFFTRCLANVRFVGKTPRPILTDGFAFTVPVADEPVLLGGEIAAQLTRIVLDESVLTDGLIKSAATWPFPLRLAFHDHFRRHRSLTLRQCCDPRNHCRRELQFAFTHASLRQELLPTLRTLLIRYAQDPQAHAARLLESAASFAVAQSPDTRRPTLGTLISDYRKWLNGHWKKAPPQLEAELLQQLLEHQTAVVAQLKAWATQDPAASSTWRAMIAPAREHLARLRHLAQSLRTRTWHEATVEIIPTRAPLDIFLPYQTEDCGKSDLEFYWSDAYQPMRIVVDRMWVGGLYVARGARRDLFISLGPREQLMVHPQIFLMRLLQGMSVLGSREDLNVLLPTDESAQGNRVSLMWEIANQSWLPPGQCATTVRRRFGLNGLFAAHRRPYYAIYRRGESVATDGITILRPSRGADMWHRVAP